MNDDDKGWKGDPPCAYCRFQTPPNDRIRLPGIRGDVAHATCAMKATRDALCAQASATTKGTRP